MQKNPYPGKFIVFEGLDKSGKSTEAKLLFEYLKSQGRAVILAKDPPEDNEIGQLIRKVLTNKEKVLSRSLQLLFAANREIYLENSVIPALKEGKIVISDRYFFSSFAYGSIDGLNLDWLIEVNGQFIMPDLTIFIDTSPEVCMERLNTMGANQEFFEKLEKLQKAQETYRELAGRFENICSVNGEQGIEEVFEGIKEIVGKCL